MKTNADVLNATVLKAIFNLTTRSLTKISNADELNMFNSKDSSNFKEYNKLVNSVILDKIRFRLEGVK